MDTPVLGIKVDVDTYRGMRDGVPRLMRILADRGIRASFFIAMGPDNSGRAALRFFTRRGFLKKMLRSRAVGMYGLRTALSGTLLPARQIARSFPHLFTELSRTGHEVGVHGHDHVRWHDRLPRMSRAETEEEIGNAVRIYKDITGRGPGSSAAPGWTCSPHQLSIQDASGMIYHSDCRGTAPFFPAMGGIAFTHLQIPTTLPTLDELLGSGSCRSPQSLTDFYLEKICASGWHVLTVHAEAEGMSWADWFSGLLDALARRGVRIVMLREMAETALAARERIPRCELRMGEIPGRAGLVALQMLK